MKIGYTRVSTAEQNADLQRAALLKEGAEKIFAESISGTTLERPELNKCLSMLREGDVLIVWKLDRLGRSLAHLVQLMNELKEQGVHINFVADRIDTTTAAGNFFFHIMAAMAEFERQTIVQRTKAGLEAAKARGVKLGRKSKLSAQQKAAARKMLREGSSYKEVAQIFEISVPSLYRNFPRGSL